jgi:asparagine synthase (glutamine-hydrolysing)
LRSLLHRNDRLGMGASIEARFPFLDHELVAFAVNLPYTAKMRLGLSLDPTHRLVKDKWVVRQVARRYLPRCISEKRKRGFPFSGFTRLEVAPGYFDDSPLADILDIPANALKSLLERSSENGRMRLLQLDIWSRVCLYRLPGAQAVARLRDHTSRPVTR